MKEILDALKKAGPTLLALFLYDFLKKNLKPILKNMGLMTYEPSSEDLNRIASAVATSVAQSLGTGASANLSGILTGAGSTAGGGASLPATTTPVTSPDANWQSLLAGLTGAQTSGTADDVSQKVDDALSQLFGLRSAKSQGYSIAP